MTARIDVPHRTTEKMAPSRKVRTYFHQDCSTCGRRLMVRVELLGKVVSCGHCGRRFEATGEMDGVPREDPVLARANRLLALLESSGHNGRRVRTA